MLLYFSISLSNLKKKIQIPTIFFKKKIVGTARQGIFLRRHLILISAFVNPYILT